MRALYSVIYLLVLGVTFVLGRLLAIFAGVATSGSTVSFFVVLACAALLAALGYAFEEPLIWARMPGRDAKLPAWIGQPRSPRLAGFAPPPASLGLAVGLVSVLVASP